MTSKMLLIIFNIFIYILTTKSTEILYQNKFLLNNEKWFIIGNKNYEESIHQSYVIINSLSHYIISKDNLINVDYINKNDKTLWYFKSPDIVINEEYKQGANIKNKKLYKIPQLLTFMMTSFQGNFNKLNENIALVKLKNKKKCLTFKAPQYDGNSREFNVPFVNILWKNEDDLYNSYNHKDIVSQDELNNMFNGPFTIEILGDWTQGNEIIGLDNVIIM